MLLGPVALDLRDEYTGGPVIGEATLTLEIEDGPHRLSGSSPTVSGAPWFCTSRPPFGTGRSGVTSTTSPAASGKPSTSTSDMNLPIWRGGKFTTAATCLPTSRSGA